MNFSMEKPCDNCPFLKSGKGVQLRAGRIKELVANLTRHERTFACHKTTVPREDDDGECTREEDGNSQHCAGALIFCEKQGRIPQMVRIAERLSLYDPTKFTKRVKASVIDTEHEWLQLATDPPKKGTGEPCSVADEKCEAPAGFMAYGSAEENESADAEFECALCSLPVCGPCSEERIRKGKKIRVCDDCVESEK